MCCRVLLVGGVLRLGWGFCVRVGGGESSGVGMVFRDSPASLVADSPASWTVHVSMDFPRDVETTNLHCAFGGSGDGSSGGAGTGVLVRRASIDGGGAGGGGAKTS